MSKNKQAEVVSVRNRVAEKVDAKKIAEAVLKRLDEKVLDRAGRRLIVNSSDGDLVVYRDNVKSRLVIEHPRIGKQTCRISLRGVYCATGDSIRDFKKFLEDNPLTLSYFSLLQL